MKLKNVYYDARRTMNRKIFDKEDQVELSWLDKRINEIGFVPFHALYIAEEVHRFATIVETKGKLKRRFQ